MGWVCGEYLDAKGFGQHAFLLAGIEGLLKGPESLHAHFGRLAAAVSQRACLLESEMLG